ncbi:MAG: FAD-binding domain [Proteobacteria bacterium]|nr:FAD-binding domain [Pseudomonadota bacterium]
MKIAISGAGVAGPTLAYWLLRAGHEPTLIERAPQPRTGGYIIDFWGVGFTVAERMGLLPDICDAGYKVREVRLVDGQGRKTGGFSTELFRVSLDDRFISVPRSQLADAIYRSIEGRCEALFGETVTALSDHGDRVDLTLAKSGSRVFDLVIGTDGQHSAIRRLAFGPEARFERDIGYRVAAFEADGYAPRDELVYVSHAKPGRQLARFAERDGRTLFLFVFAADHLDDAESHHADARRKTLQRVFGDFGWEAPKILAALDAARDLYFDRVSQIVMPAWSTGRVALLGDAAACVSLLAGEGCGLAMAEAYVLAGELARAGTDHTRAFGQYEQRLRPLIATKQAAARKFAGAFAPRTAFGLWTRNQATKLMAWRPLAQFFLGRDLRDDFDLPDYGL